MKRQTNLDKWNYWLNLITEKEQQFIKSELPNYPDKIFKVYHNGKFATMLINSIGYYHYMNKNNFPLSFFTKRPTAKDVEKLQTYYEANIPLIKERIYLGYTENLGTHSLSGSLRWLDKNETKGLMLDENEAIEKSKELTERNNSRTAFLAEHKKDANYNYNANGYKFLGWQNGWKHVYFDVDGNVTEDATVRRTFGYLTADYPEYGACRDAHHFHIEVSHNGRGSENTVSCPICKIYWKYDCSD